jgi:hypothetical protein
LINELLMAVSAFFAPAAVSVAAESHPPTSVVVFVDFSGSIQGTARAGYRRELETNILPYLAAGDRLMVASIHDKTLTGFRPLVEATLPPMPQFNGFVDNTLKHAQNVKETERIIATTRQQIKADVAETFAKPLASRYTDIFSSLAMAEKYFDGDSRRKVVVLMSDMIEDNPPYKFDAMGWRPGDTGKLVNELAAKRLIPDLSGVCVYVSGASARDAALAGHISAFWQAYFTRAGADFDPARYAHVLLHWPPSKSCRSR